jgi:hypothetical protein
LSLNHNPAVVVLLPLQCFDSSAVQASDKPSGC